jgi:hypothetical protein
MNNLMFYLAIAVVWLMGAAIIIQQHWHIEVAQKGNLMAMPPGEPGTILCLKANGEVFYALPEQCKE